MIRHGIALLVALGSGFARDPGCGDVDAPKGGTNAPCTRSSDCKHALACLEGVCRDPETTTDAGGAAVDAAPPADAGGGG